MGIASSGARGAPLVPLAGGTTTLPWSHPAHGTISGRTNGSPAGSTAKDRAAQ